MPTNEEIADVIDKAHDVLLTDGWCQGTLEDDEGRVCAAGALHRAAWMQSDGLLEVMRDLYQETWDVVDSYDVVSPTLPFWNDAPDRTVDDVLDVFRAVAKELRK